MTNRSTTDRLDKPPPTDWHTLPHAQVEQTLQSGTRGLSDAEARRRLSQYGPNRLAPPKRRGPLLRLLMQFHNILLYVMIGAAVITALLGHWIDTGVLMMAVVINAIIGFIQEGKAESALDAIRAMLSPHAMVIRDGQRREIDAADLVPGDVVALASGDRVPADGDVVEGLLIVQNYDHEDNSPRFREFSEAYFKRFQRSPGYSSVSAYDAATVVLDALRKRQGGETLKDAPLKNSPYQGLQQEIAFDANGDTPRKVFFTEIRGGRYVKIP